MPSLVPVIFQETAVLEGQAEKKRNATENRVCLCLTKWLFIVHFPPAGAKV